VTEQENLSDYDAGISEGMRVVYRRLLIECLAKLGYDSTEGKLVALVEQHERAVIELRSVYSEWPKNLDLADAIKITLEYVYQHGIKVAGK